MQIFLRTSSGVAAYEVADNESVFALKQNIQASQAIAIEDQVIFHEGSQLEDDQVLSECLSQGASVEVSLRMLGGKVHGSLARAGKVKGQTPKVDKAENKKKKPTGRAKRRLQYNRRFVNAIKTPGRKRGPNANA